MTTPKARPIKSFQHLRNAAEYIGDGKDKARAFASQNIVDEGGWLHEMEHTILSYHHDVAGASGANPTLALHHIIAFLPDECAQNGGPIDANEALAYAMDYAKRAWPNQQVVCQIHDEGDRMAAHLVLNRSDLLSGNRYRYDTKEIRRLDSIKRDLDSRWGLAEVKPGRNSKIRGRSGVTATQRYYEKINSRNLDKGNSYRKISWKAETIDRLLSAVKGVVSMSAFEQQLAKVGVLVEEIKGKTYYRDTNISFKGNGEPYKKYPLSAERLSAYQLDRAGLDERFKTNASYRAALKRCDGSLGTRRGVMRLGRSQARSFRVGATWQSEDIFKPEHRMAIKAEQERLLDPKNRELSEEEYRQCGGLWRHRELNVSEIAKLTPTQRREYRRQLDRECDELTTVSDTPAWEVPSDYDALPERTDRQPAYKKARDEGGR